LTIEPQRVIGAIERARHKSPFLREFQKFKNIIGRQSGLNFIAVGVSYLLVASFCFGLAVRWDAAVFGGVVVAVLLLVVHFLLGEEEN